METLTIQSVQKYKGRSNKWLKDKAQFYFNRFVRLRDQGQGCISCGSHNTEHASHYFSAGSYSALRYAEDNVHLGCKHCNYFKSGNLLEYRKRLVKKIGTERLLKLEQQASRGRVHKWDDYTLITIIETYKAKCREYGD